MADMPKLPEPQKVCWIGHTLFTADQMQSYARAALASMQARLDAADDLLAVVMKLRRGDLHQRVRHLWDEAQAAIVKATGAKP